MSAPRKITDVMERIRPLLVNGGVDMLFFDRLDRALGFAAPETHPAFWHPLCEWLSKTLPNPTLPGAPTWVKEVSAIIENKEPSRKPARSVGACPVCGETNRHVCRVES